MARMTAVLERLAWAEEAACLRALGEDNDFRSTLNEAMLGWEGASGDWRADKVLALSEIVQRTAPDLVWLYGPYLHLYLGCLI
jgi:hypothetical protein